jgi:hypothetical protein
MAKSLEELSREVDDLTRTYDALFAGKPRATRELNVLDEIIAGLEGARAALAELSDGATKLAEVDDNLKLYNEERALIVQTQAQGEHVVTGAKLATWANFVFDEYHRHFAGKPRPTRDVERMKEMVAELDTIGSDMDDVLEAHPEMDSVKQDLAAVDANLKMYREELVRIAEGRVSGTRDEQASTFATAANDQFQIYAALFAGKSRLTRRPGLLERMIRNLELILNGMRELNSKGYRNEMNAKNIRIVQDNLKMYKDELTQVKTARGAEDADTLAGNLGGAANDLMEQYRQNFAGAARATRDLGMLSALCDGLYEIALQMRTLDEEHPGHEINGRNLNIVMDNLILYNAEYRRIEEAKGPRA